MNRAQFMAELHYVVKGRQGTKASTLVPWDDYTFTDGFLQAQRYYQDTEVEVKRAKSHIGTQIHYADLIVAKLLVNAFRYLMLHGDTLPDIPFPTLHSTSQEAKVATLDRYADQIRLVT